MCAKWLDKSENSVEILLRQIELCKILDSDGNHRGFDFNYQDYATAIESYLIFNNEIPDTERYLILNRAISNAAETTPLTPKALLGYISKLENKYLDKPKIKYILATSISIRFLEDLKRITINGIPIIFSRNLPRNFNRKSNIKSVKKITGREPSINYTSVRLYVKARGINEAFQVAMDALDLLRGIWNLRANGEIVFDFNSSSRREPVNKITLGLLHTLHYPDGSTATDFDFCWYEPDYIERVQDLSRNWKEIRKFEKDVRKFLSKHNYKSDLEDSIKQYSRALDYVDLHISYLELWIILEKLTATTNAQYEKMIERVAFLYKEVDLHKQVLQHLRLYRNANIHAGQRTVRVEKYVYQLKRYVEGIFWFQIRNFYKFKSLRESAEFLDLSIDTDRLKKRVMLLNQAIKFRSS